MAAMSVDRILDAGAAAVDLGAHHVKQLQLPKAALQDEEYRRLGGDDLLDRVMKAG